MTYLLDSNLLIALTVERHVHADAAAAWFDERDDLFATTPITQGSLVRYLLRSGVEAEEAVTGMHGLTSHARHEFWPDDRPYTSEILAGVIGHRQVTDAYLAAQARRRGGRLATFDRGLAAQHQDVAELVPT